MSCEHGIIGPCSECQAIRDQVALEARIRADEREACARMLEDAGRDADSRPGTDNGKTGETFRDAAELVRARGSKP